MDLYRAGLDTGHDIVLYFGEWDTSIQRLLGDWATEKLQEILDEGRKTNVWIGFVEVHGAQVKRFGGDSATRAAFGTRLVGNVDDTSWRVFAGKTPKQRVPRGKWMTEYGWITVNPPHDSDIIGLAQHVQPYPFVRVLSSVSEDSILNDVQAYVNDLNVRSPLPDARSSSVQRSAFSVQNDDSAIPVNVQELRMLAKAVTLKTRGSTKQEAIETAFGCKKGAGDNWRRASFLFDEAQKES